MYEKRIETYGTADLYFDMREVGMFSRGTA
jgi:hypothetical protein